MERASVAVEQENDHIDPESLVARIVEELRANPAAQRLLLRTLLTNEFLVLTAEERAFLDQFQDKLGGTTDPKLSKYMTGKMLIALTSAGLSLARAWAIVRPQQRQASSGSPKTLRVSRPPEVHPRNGSR